MNYYNRFGYKNELNIQENDRVEIILRSSLYCDENEVPQYHSGTVSEVVLEEFKDGKHPIGIYVKFDKDSLYEDQEEELVLFNDIEDVFVKKYDVSGYSELNEGMTLSVKGKGFGKIIWFSYKEGNLIAEGISNGNITVKSAITEEDKVLIREINKYGIYQELSHGLLFKSK